jgi:hypothetical protein
MQRKKKNDQRWIIKNDDIKIYFNFPENFQVFMAFIKKLFLAAVCLLALLISPGHVIKWMMVWNE